MAVYKRGDVWWYRFVWNGVEVRQSTKQGNKRIAEQIEAAHETSLAKGEVGLREAKKSPSLLTFAQGEFMAYISNHFEAKPAIQTYYAAGVRSIVGHLRN